MYISKRFNDIINEFKNKKNSHSYIFYTNDFFSCQKDVYELIKNIFEKSSIDDNDSDLIIIKKSEKKNILKEDMMVLKNMFKNTTYLNKYRIYLIEEAHKLNSTTSNMILKFLEEPMDGVIALFITDNLDLVLSTIKSRCQIVNVFYENIQISNNEKNIEKLKHLLFNSNKYFSLINIKNEYSNIERDELILLLKQLIDNLMSNLEINVFKIKLLNEAITLLSKNVNIDYVFDYIIIKGSEQYEFSIY